MRNLAHAVKLGPVTWRDFACAVYELACARRKIGTKRARDLVTRQKRMAPASELRVATPRTARLIERVAFVVPRVAARVPWRADCLVQALAAERWLARHGISTSLHIGVRKDAPHAFEAHAWLEHRGQIITGGDISSYSCIDLSSRRDS